MTREHWRTRCRRRPRRGAESLRSSRAVDSCASDRECRRRRAVRALPRFSSYFFGKEVRRSEVSIARHCQNRAARLECERKRPTQRHCAEKIVWLRQRGGGVGPHILAVTASHPVCLLREAPKKAKAKGKFTPHKFGSWNSKRGLYMPAVPSQCSFVEHLLKLERYRED